MTEFKRTRKCDQCGKKKPLADTFIFEEEAYCMDCLYPLIMDMAESGNLNLNFDKCEETGIQVSY